MSLSVRLRRGACFGSSPFAVGRRGCEASSAGVLGGALGHPELLRVAALRALRAQQLAQYMTAEVELACDRGTRAGHTSADICVDDYRSLDVDFVSH